MKDPYLILDVDIMATDVKIKKAYRSLALKYHPDRVRGEQEKIEARKAFIDIQWAYNILKDDIKRASYDKYGTVDGEEKDLSNMDSVLNKFNKGLRKDLDEIKPIEEIKQEKITEASKGEGIKTECGICEGLGTVEEGKGFFTLVKKCDNCSGEGFITKPIYINNYYDKYNLTGCPDKIAYGA